MITTERICNRDQRVPASSLQINFKMYLSKLKSVFVQIEICICPN